MRRADLISAAVFAGLGLVAIFYLIPNYVAPSPWSGDLSPAFMPYLAAVLGTGAMVLLFFVRLLRRVSDDEVAPLTDGSWAFIASAAAVMAAAFMLFEHAGYVWGAAFIVAGFMALVRASAWVIAAAAVAFPAALWLLFDRLLGFPLP